MIVITRQCKNFLHQQYMKIKLIINQAENERKKNIVT